MCFSIWDSRFIARSQSLESQAGSRISKVNLDRVRSRPGLQCHCWAGHWSNWLPRANLTNWQAVDFTIEFWQIYNILIIIILWECVFDPATIYCPTDVQQVAVPGSRPCDIEGHANFKWSASHYFINLRSIHGVVYYAYLFFLWHIMTLNLYLLMKTVAVCHCLFHLWILDIGSMPKIQTFVADLGVACASWHCTVVTWQFRNSS